MTLLVGQSLGFSIARGGTIGFESLGRFGDDLAEPVATGATNLRTFDNSLSGSLGLRGYFRAARGFVPVAGLRLLI